MMELDTKILSGRRLVVILRYRSSSCNGISAVAKLDANIQNSNDLDLPKKGWLSQNPGLINEEVKRSDK